MLIPGVSTHTNNIGELGLSYAGDGRKNDHCILRTIGHCVGKPINISIYIF